MHLESTCVEKSPSPVINTSFSSNTHVNQTPSSKDVDLDAEYEAFKVLSFINEFIFNVFY